MRRLQGSSLLKTAVSLLALVFLYLAGLSFGVVLETSDVLSSSYWYDTASVLLAAGQRANSVASLFASRQELEQLKEEAQAGEDRGYRISRLEQTIQELERSLSPSGTCFRWRVTDIHGERLDSNLEEWDSLEDYGTFFVMDAFHPGNHYIDHTLEAWEGWLSLYSAGEIQDPSTDPDSLGTVPPYLIEYALPDTVPQTVHDEFAQFYSTFLDHQALLPHHMAGLSLLLACSLVCLGILLWSCGHRTGEEGIVTGWQEAIWLDVYWAISLCLFTGALLLIFILGEMLPGNLDYPAYAENTPLSSLVEYGVAALFALGGVVVGLCLRTTAVRIKAGTFSRSFLLRIPFTALRRLGHRCGEIMGQFARGIPLFWKVLLLGGLYVTGSFLVIAGGLFNYKGFLLLWLGATVVILLVACWWSLGFQQLRRTTRAMVAGDLDSPVPTRNLLPDLKAHAEDLSNLSLGLNSAVEEKTRSERFKAELITNVSHDLKTPLTSIINYVDLLKTTQQTDPRATEYIEVLDRKSQRLKKLTEDLVEASKASTGVLRVEREKIGMSQLIDQAMAEWTEKLEDSRLTLVCTLPESETWVQADGRHLWRVLDNLLSNCCKYALEGTRVYLDLVRGKGQVTLSVKNISREPLNIPPEQLMERFVRGEESRSSEGSGLGLSIARSLTELQGGTFDLFVDGDLFKAVLTLPQAG